MARLWMRPLRRHRQSEAHIRLFISGIVNIPVVQRLRLMSGNLPMSFELTTATLRSACGPAIGAIERSIMNFPDLSFQGLLEEDEHEDKVEVLQEVFQIFLLCRCYGLRYAGSKNLCGRSFPGANGPRSSREVLQLPGKAVQG